MELFLHSDGSAGKRTKARGVVLGVFHALATSVIQLREVPLCAWGTSCLGTWMGSGRLPWDRRQVLSRRS